MTKRMSLFALLRERKHTDEMLEERVRMCMDSLAALAKVVEPLRGTAWACSPDCKICNAVPEDYNMDD